MTILLFARTRDLVGVDRIVIDAPEPATVGELRERIARMHPHIAELLAKSAIAVNDEFASDMVRIPAGAEVALLPPVSGG
jgi:molybdopterin converting factor subunit 1